MTLLKNVILHLPYRMQLWTIWKMSLFLMYAENLKRLKFNSLQKCTLKPLLTCSTLVRKVQALRTAVLTAACDASIKKRKSIDKYFPHYVNASAGAFMHDAARYVSKQHFKN